MRKHHIICRNWYYNSFKTPTCKKNYIILYFQIIIIIIIILIIQIVSQCKITIIIITIIIILIIDVVCWGELVYIFLTIGSVFLTIGSVFLQLGQISYNVIFFLSGFDGVLWMFVIKFLKILQFRKLFENKKKTKKIFKK